MARRLNKQLMSKTNGMKGCLHREAQGKDRGYTGKPKGSLVGKICGEGEACKVSHQGSWRILAKFTFAYLAGYTDLMLAVLSFACCARYSHITEGSEVDALLAKGQI